MFPAGAGFAAQPWATAALVVLGCVGYVAVGTLFAAGLATGSGKNTLLFVILYPVTTPLLMYALVTTRALLDGDPAVVDYLGQMVALDVILFTLAALLFESVLVGAAAKPPTRAARSDHRAPPVA
jgi:heme exporter protein B